MTHVFCVLSSSVRLYHVKGSTPLNTYAVQVPAKAANLNSGEQQYREPAASERCCMCRLRKAVMQLTR